MTAEVGAATDEVRRFERELAAAHAQLVRYAHDLRLMLDRERARATQLEAAYMDTLLRLTRAAACKDSETGAHLERLSHYSLLLAEQLGLPQEDAERIAAAAPLHDVGKIGIPDAILVKAGPLTEDEWEVMRRHTTLGADLLAGSHSPLIETARQIALTHHERWDGGGYPQGLRTEETPIAGRIVMFVDRYDALRSSRHYKPAFDHETATALMMGNGDRSQRSHFDPKLLEIFRESHEKLAVIYEQHCN